ncbi:MAG: aminoacyl-histidine dipeptidase [Bacteroidales bacterium]|nr:aminoacyl-histidine dipeptidase [Bacteroidales bacterium]
MNEVLKTLEPSGVWNYFREILEIPRPSKKEEKIAAYLIRFAKKHHLECKQDETGNILISKPATNGFQNKKTVVLQSHIDMVCEKNSDKIHDFENDPIEVFIKDGWVRTNGTTLGADDGIGIATQLAILTDDTIEHGPIECLFTIDEETGLTGAFGLQRGFLNAEILLNLDSEDEGELFIGCAGGKDTVITLPFTTEALPKGFKNFSLTVSGLNGGHSGDDIHKGFGNANKILNRILWETSQRFGIRLSFIEGGNLRNAIAREANAIILVPEANVSHIEKFVNQFFTDLKKEYYVTEPNLKISLTATKAKIDKVVSTDDQMKLINSLYACPHGVIAMSQSIANFVETSTNLASVRMLEKEFVITTSQRSSIESAKDDVANMVRSCFELAGASVSHTDGYPGWAPNPKSEIREITEEAYFNLFLSKPQVKAIHAGLECGLIGDKYPSMDMISFGPTIKGAHSPDERLDIESVTKFWKLTLSVLKWIPLKG